MGTLVCEGIDIILQFTLLTSILDYAFSEAFVNFRFVQIYNIQYLSNRNDENET